LRDLLEEVPKRASRMLSHGVVCPMRAVCENLAQKSHGLFLQQFPDESVGEFKRRAG